MGIYNKLLEIQQELKVPKGQYNSFSNFYYRSCEDILDAAKPILAKHGCVLMLRDTLTQVGSRVYVQVTATLYDTESGEQTQNTASAREDETKKGMDGAQITGAASSYARKYCLNGLFCLDDNKDADTPEYQQKPQGRQQSKTQNAQAGEKVDAKQIAALQVKAKEKGVSIGSIIEKSGISRIEDMTKAVWAKTMTALGKMADKSG